MFRASVNGAFSSQQSTSARSLNGDLAADRTTEEWKFNLQLDARYRRNDFDLDDSTTITSVTESYGANALLVGALGDHFSAGVRGRVASSSFANQDLLVRIARLAGAGGVACKRPEAPVAVRVALLVRRLPDPPDAWPRRRY